MSVCSISYESLTGIRYKPYEEKKLSKKNNSECKRERGFIDQLYIELGLWVTLLA
jgi:hypothetical protein